MLIILKAVTAAATTQVPAELRGYWQLPNKIESKDDWAGINVGENYVEFVYALFSVDSIHQSDKNYTLFLNLEGKWNVTMSIELSANDSAAIELKQYNMSERCKRYDRDPEINFLPVADFSKVIAGKRFDDSNTRESFAIEKGKLLYDGKRWNILWLGEVKKHQYRSIIEREGNYRMIWFDRLEDNSLKVSYYGKTSLYKPKESGSKLAIVGNWYEPEGNAWVFGFFEKFAIYDGKFWDYKTLNLQEYKGTATLTNGNESLQLTFQKNKDNTLQVVINNQNAVTYHLAGRTLPPYKTSDTTSFIDTHYARIDTAYISGYLRYKKRKEPFKIAVRDPISDNEVSFYGNVDDLGRFEMKVPLYNSSMAYFEWGQMNVLEPNEHYVVFYDEIGKQTLFMGKNTRCQNELATIDFFKMPQGNKVSGKTTLDFLSAQKSVFAVRKAYMDSIINQMPNPSYKFRYFSNNYIRYNIAFDLMQRRFFLDRKNQEQFPVEYMDFARDTLLSNPIHPVTLNRDLLNFIRDYVGYYTDQKGAISVNTIDALLSLIKSEKIKLDASDYQLVETIKTAIGFELKGDTVQAKKVVANFTQKEIDRLNNITNKVQNKKAISAELSRMTSEMRLKRTIEALHEEIQDKSIRDYYVAKSLYEKLNGDRAPLDSKLLDSLLVQVESPAFRKKVMDAQTFYTELSGQSIEHVESLKNTDHLSNAKNADSLWVELIRPYKGKIIYVDFWGTWCGPCKKEMEYVADLKKQFVGKDVVFMYLANNSPEVSWKNVIKDYSLTGENVVHYRLPAEQQTMIEQRFGVNAFPTYMIVDRNGNIVNTDPPSPSQKQATVSFLNDWLEKKNENTEIKR